MPSIRDQIKTAKQQIKSEIESIVKQVTEDLHDNLQLGTPVVSGLTAANYKFSVGFPREGDYTPHTDFGVSQEQWEEHLTKVWAGEPTERLIPRQPSGVKRVTLGKRAWLTNPVPWINEVNLRHLDFIGTAVQSTVTNANQKYKK